MSPLNIRCELERLSRHWAFCTLICREQKACRDQGGLWVYEAVLGPVSKRSIFRLSLLEVLIQTRAAVYTYRCTVPSCRTRPKVSSVDILLLEEFPAERRIKYQIKCY